MEEPTMAMDPLYLKEIPLLQGIQSNLDGYDDWLQKVSKVGDPGLMFTFYFPVIFAINLFAGTKFLGTVVACEWMNLTLKWLLHGERPYWWTHATNLSTPLRQTPMTCETGPGNPSGHVMISMVLWLTVYDILKKILGPSQTPVRLMIGRLLWNGVLMMQFLVIASRTYIAAHFLHQCGLALIFGLFVHKLSYHNLRWIDYPLVVLVLVAIAFPVSAFGIYNYLETLLGFSPDWSIERATKWCQNENWIYLDSTPLYALMRFSGSAAGLVFAVGSFRMKNLKVSSNLLSSKSQKLAQLVLGLFVGQISIGIHQTLPRTDMTIFYALEYLLNGGIVYTIAFLLPTLVRFVIPHQRRRHAP